MNLNSQWQKEALTHSNVNYSFYSRQKKITERQPVRVTLQNKHIKTFRALYSKAVSDYSSLTTVYAYLCSSNVLLSIKFSVHGENLRRAPSNKQCSMMVVIVRPLPDALPDVYLANGTLAFRMLFQPTIIGFHSSIGTYNGCTLAPKPFRTNAFVAFFRSISHWEQNPTSRLDKVATGVMSFGTNDSGCLTTGLGDNEWQITSQRSGETCGVYKFFPTLTFCCGVLFSPDAHWHDSLFTSSISVKSS